jgi:hypothetical protein
MDSSCRCCGTLAGSVGCDGRVQRSTQRQREAGSRRSAAVRTLARSIHLADSPHSGGPDLCGEASRCTPTASSTLRRVSRKLRPGRC